MKDTWTDRLSEYVDGELDSSAAAALEEHLAVCDECRATADDLRTISRAASALDAVPPGRDLWPAIAAEIGVQTPAPADQLGARRSTKPGRSFTFTIPQLAAAALVVLSLGAALMWQVDRSTGGSPVATNDGADSAVRTVGMATSNEIGYDAAIEQLEMAAERNREQLDTSTVRILDESMRTIDRAVADARAALARDPANPYLHRHLDRTMKQKLEILRRAATLDRGGV